MHNLISDDYRDQQKQMHANYEYGTASIGFAPLVTKFIDAYEVNEMLDYGAGRGNLAKHIKPGRKIDIYQYEPADEDCSEAPSPCGFVCCIDVLEHIEPDCLDAVLDDLMRVTEKYGFFSIHTGAAMKKLPDGRNAHLIQEPFTWWMPKIKERFNVKSFSHTSNGFYIAVESLPCETNEAA